MESFGFYTILESLRVGTLGELLRARDVRLGRTVALRLVSPTVVEEPGSRDRLLADARAAAVLSHPHITALFEFGEEGGQVFLAHEYVPGQSLRSLLTGKPLETSLVHEFAVELADALAEGHRQGVVHGDLSPSTILITPTDQTKILDFGLSAWTSGGVTRRLVAEQLAAGKEPDAPGANAVVPYMAPEHLLTGRADRQSDIFSLGVVLYEMLTGRVPFGSNTPGTTAVKVLQGTPPPPSRLNKAVPEGFDAIVSKALAKSLDARYGSASDMVSDLRALAATLNVRVSAEVERGAKAKPRKPLGPLLKRVARWSLAVVLIGAAGAAAWNWRDRVLRLFTGQAAPPSPVIIVMPFQMEGGEAGREYFGTGFAEELAGWLGEVQGLTVVGRTSIAATPGLSMIERAAIAGAAVGLRGTVRPGPYSFRASAELVDVKTGQAIWSQSLSREPRQAPAAEAEIARQVAERLRLPTPTGGRWIRAKNRQVDPGAYDFYLQGRSAARADRSRAITLYRQALEMDPGLTEAHVALSEALFFDAFDRGDSGNQTAVEQARREAELALAADSELPRAQVALALTAATAGTAASSLARALSSDPTSGETWHHAGDLVLEADPARAIGYYKRALQLEPMLDASRVGLASAQEMLDRFGDAATELGLGDAARPDRPWWKQMRTRLELAQANYAAAAEMLAGDPATETTPMAWLIGRVTPVAMVSRFDEARKDAVRFTERYPGFCEGQALLAALEWEGDVRARAHAREMAAAIFARTEAPGASTGLLQCAAEASAALDDGPGAASYLAKIASNDRALRIWARADVFTTAFAFRRQLYPWNKVETSGPFRQARTALIEGLARLRDEVSRRLPPPPRL